MPLFVTRFVFFFAVGVTNPGIHQNEILFFLVTAGTRLKSIMKVLTVSLQFIYEIFSSGLSSPVNMVVRMFEGGFMFLFLLFTTMKKIILRNSDSSGGQGPPPDPRPPGSKKIVKTQISSLKKSSPAPPPPPPSSFSPPKPPVVKPKTVKTPVAVARPVPVPIQQSSSEVARNQNSSPMMLLTLPSHDVSSSTTRPLPLSRKILRNMWRTACLCLAVLVLAPRNEYNFQSIQNLRGLVMESNIYQLLISKTKSAQAAILRFYHRKVQGPERNDAEISTAKASTIPVFLGRHNIEISNGCPFLKKL